ncbi:hypothetical protein AC249_AIPGENE5276, partial [Exaiptasia diaphana]
DEEKQTKKTKERKNKVKKNDKQKKMKNKGQQTSSFDSEISPKKAQKDKTSLLSFLRIGRNKKHA